MKKVSAILLTFILALSLAACGGGSKTPEPAAPSQAAPTEQDAGDTEDEGDADAEDDADADDEGDAEDEGTIIEYDLDVISSSITEAYLGVMETGEMAAFGVNDDGSFAVMLFAGEQQHVTFVGPATMDSNNMVTIVDDVNGLQITFEVLLAEEDGVVIDLGELGGGILAKCSIDELINLFAEAVTNTAAVG